MTKRNQNSETASVTFGVRGMSCMSCVARIETALTKLPGFQTVRADLTTGRVEVMYAPSRIGVSDLAAAISATGYQTAPIGEGPPMASHLEKQRFSLRPYFYGMLVALGAVAFYLGLITLTSDWGNAKMQYGEYGWWVTALAVGIGLQLTLFVTMRRRFNSSALRSARSSVAASGGGVSTAAMAVCCSHYLGILLPLIGLPFLAAFASGLAAYQVEFFLTGVVFNLIGIGIMVRQLKMHLIPVSAVLG